MKAVSLLLFFFWRFLLLISCTSSSRGQIVIKSSGEASFEGLDTELRRKISAFQFAGCHPRPGAVQPHIPFAALSW